MTNYNEKSLKNLRPWKTGESGNVYGGPKGLASLVRDKTLKGKLLIEKALELLDGKNKPLILETIKWLAERGWGKISFDMTPLEGVNPNDIDVVEVIRLKLKNNANTDHIPDRALPEQIVEASESLPDKD